jgi:hypothetical protein
MKDNLKYLINNWEDEVPNVLKSKIIDEHGDGKTYSSFFGNNIYKRVSLIGEVGKQEFVFKKCLDFLSDEMLFETLKNTLYFIYFMSIYGQVSVDEKSLIEDVDKEKFTPLLNAMLLKKVDSSKKIEATLKKRFINVENIWNKQVKELLSRNLNNILKEFNKRKIDRCFRYFSRENVEAIENILGGVKENISLIAYYNKIDGLPHLFYIYDFFHGFMHEKYSKNDLELFSAIYDRIQNIEIPEKLIVVKHMIKVIEIFSLHNSIIGEERTLKTIDKIVSNFEKINNDVVKEGLKKMLDWDKQWVATQILKVIENKKEKLKNYPVLMKIVDESNLTFNDTEPDDIQHCVSLIMNYNKIIYLNNRSAGEKISEAMIHTYLMTLQEQLNKEDIEYINVILKNKEAQFIISNPRSCNFNDNKLKNFAKSLMNILLFEQDIKNNLNNIKIKPWCENTVLSFQIGEDKLSIVKNKNIKF